MARLMDRILAGARASGERAQGRTNLQPRRPVRGLPSYAYGPGGKPLAARAAGAGLAAPAEPLSEETAKAESLPLSETASGFARTWILALVFITPAVLPILAATPVHDPDIWWHLATGRWIWEHGVLPQHDPFHVGSGAVDWIAYSWLYDVGIYKLYLHFGLQGFFVYSVGISLAVTTALYRLIRRLEPRFVVSCVLTALVATAVWRHQGARTFLITILFTALELHILWAARRGRKVVLLLLPPLFICWANLHIQFVYGLAIIALAVLESGWDNIRGLPQWHAERDGFVFSWILPVALACCVATLANPYGWKIYVVVYQYMTQLAPWTYLAELRAPTFRSVFDWLSLAVALGGAFCLGQRGTARPFTLGLLALAAFLSFHAMRDTWLVAMVGAVLMADGGRKFVRPKLGLARAGRALKVSLAVAVTVALVWTVAKTDEADLDIAVASRFPARAADYVAEHGYRGRLFNHFNWGGYFIWRLPELEVSIDGRTNVYGDRILERSMETWSGLEGWRQDVDLVSADVVVASVAESLTSLLAADRRFRRVYKDDLAVVFVPVGR